MAAGPNRRTRWLAVLGPGILFASTAIGVSHLVQSTRAGAIAGFGLSGPLWLRMWRSIPEFGSRYANATGESLVEGYRSLGRPAAWGYFIIALGPASLSWGRGHCHGRVSGQPLWHFCSDRVQCDTGGGRGGIRAGDRPTDLGGLPGLGRFDQGDCGRVIGKHHRGLLERDLPHCVG